MEESAKSRRICVAAQWTARLNGSSGHLALLLAVSGRRVEVTLSRKLRSAVEEMIVNHTRSTGNVSAQANRK